jgi:hypothetical protein
LQYTDYNIINKFESYSRHYSSIIELDRKDKKGIFENVYKIIEDAKLVFKFDNEFFYYRVKDEPIEVKIEELIDLKKKLIFNLVIKN